MKTTFFAAIIALTFFAGACNSGGNNAKADASHPLDTTKLTKGASFYQCPMDPEITSDKEASCPKCGMDLTKVEKK